MRIFFFLLITFLVFHPVSASELIEVAVGGENTATAEMIKQINHYWQTYHPERNESWKPVEVDSIEGRLSGLTSDRFSYAIVPVNSFIQYRMEQDKEWAQRKQEKVKADLNLLLSISSEDEYIPEDADPETSEEEPAKEEVLSVLGGDEDPLLVSSIMPLWEVYLVGFQKQDGIVEPEDADPVSTDLVGVMQSGHMLSKLQPRFEKMEEGDEGVPVSNWRPWSQDHTYRWVLTETIEARLQTILAKLGVYKAVSLQEEWQTYCLDELPYVSSTEISIDNGSSVQALKFQWILVSTTGEIDERVRLLKGLLSKPMRIFGVPYLVERVKKAPAVELPAGYLYPLID